MARKVRQPQPNYAREIKDAARGRWAEILSAVAGISAEVLDGGHHPCPRCGGTDRFRFTNQDGDGSIICNQCARRICGDGIAAVMWATGWPFPEVVRRVADYLGIDIVNGKRTGGGAKKPAADPAEHLEFLGWSDTLVAFLCMRKPPITPDAIKAVGGRMARYRKQYTVIALPVVGPDLDHTKPVGWVLYNITGGTLPAWKKDGTIEQVKVKTMPGTGRGFIGAFRNGLQHQGDSDNVQRQLRIIKTEGPSDLLSLISAGLNPNETSCCNVHGAKEDPKETPWLLDFVRGHDVVTVHDADESGQEGAISIGGRPGWATYMAKTAASSRLVKLPYDVTKTKGKDLRDYFAEGHTRAEFDALIEQAETIAPPEGQVGPNVIEADDDPHRLARVNLERYATTTDGRTLRFWRSEWFVWKGTRYRKISDDDLRAKLSASIKLEFDRLNIEAQEAFQRGCLLYTSDAADE